MQNVNDRIYFERRAEQERELAERTHEDLVAKPHRELAEEYERKLYELDARSDAN